MVAVDTKDCLFCRISAREVESSIVFEDDTAVAFRDVHPQASTHILVVPRKHVDSLNDMTVQDETTLGHLLNVARTLASEEKLEKNGYRVVINTGAHAGQTVKHLHVHLLGGRAFRWPPG